ncbi:MAG TPA: phage major capsid protein [Pseudonocardiaceae bacterium]|nr:phage major capsid protein [Pseudonocardiaceae bacterium]
MTVALVVPDTADGLVEAISDPTKVKEWFSQSAVTNGDTKRFLDKYAEFASKKNPGTTEDMQTQVKSVFFDLMRENGFAGSSKDLGKQLAFRSDGRPALNLSASGSAAVARGKGAVYNRTSAGAVFEAKFREEDRFGTIGEYLQAIKEERAPTANLKRKDLLQKLENVRTFQSSFGSEDPGAGGFLIPELMRSDLMMLAIEEAVVRPRATVIPMSTLRVPVPTVDDTSHASSLFGGVVWNWTEEASSITESQATFGRVVLDAKKLAGFFKVPNELLADAPAFSSFFDAVIPKGLAWQEDLAFMTETGAGTPEGFINSPASVQQAAEAGQTAGTIVWENIVKMYARMLPTSLKNAVWVAAIDTFPQLATMALSVGTGGGPVWIGGPNQPGSDGPPVTILGRPVIFTEKAPALGTTGDINFVDLSYYLIGDRQAVAVAASEHAFFQNDQVAYRIIERVDGRPWLQSALTPHNGSANTLSAFVQLASR